MGQTGCLESHVSAHWRWNPWLQPGTIRAGSSSSMSSRQTAHSFPNTRSLPVTWGSFSSSAAESPFLGGGFTGCSGSAWFAAYHKRQMYTTNTTLIPAHGKNSAKNIDNSISPTVVASFDLQPLAARLVSHNLSLSLS